MFAVQVRGARSVGDSRDPTVVARFSRTSSLTYPLCQRQLLVDVQKTVTVPQLQHI